MKNYFKFPFGIALVGLLTTACQKGEMLSPAPALTQTTTTLMSQNGKSTKPIDSKGNRQNKNPSSKMSQNGKSTKPIDIQGKGQNKAPSSNNRSRSNSPNSKSYNVHKELLSKGGYSPNTYDKHYNNYQKSDEKSSDY